MDKVPAKPCEKHVTHAELDEIVRPLAGAIVQLTSAVLDLANMAKNMPDNHYAVAKGDSAYDLIGEVIERLKEHQDVRNRILSLEGEDNE